MHVCLLLHRRSAAGWAECMIYSALVSFFPSLTLTVFCWKAEGDVSLGFGAGSAGLGCVLPRGPGSGERAVTHAGNPPVLSSGEFGGWSRGAWLSERGRVAPSPGGWGCRAVGHRRPGPRQPPHFSLIQAFYSTLFQKLGNWRNPKPKQSR